MTRHYSALSLLREGLNRQKGWQTAWRSPHPKPSYDIVVIGGGGHGVATAYYLAKRHGVSAWRWSRRAGWAAATPAATRR